MEQLFALALHQTRDGDARPARDDGGDLLLGDGVAHERVALAAALFLRLGQLLFQLGQRGIAQAGGFFVLVVPLGLLDFAVDALDVGLNCLDRLDGALFDLPARFERVEALALLRKLCGQLFQPLLGEGVAFLFQRHFLDFKLHDPAPQVIQLGRHRVDFGADGGAGLVYEVDGLVGQEAVGDVAVGQRGRRDERRVVDLHAVEDFVAVLQPAQDGDGVLHRRLVHHHGLEPALERGVLFDVFAVFVQRGRADAVQLAARKHRLEQVARVHRALGFARADDGVQLVDEQQNVAVALLHLVEHGLEPFLELAAELGAGDQRAHIEREYGFVL